MLVFKPFENFLLLPPKIFTATNSKPHLLHHLHHNHHHVKLHFSPKARFKSTLSSSPLSLSDTSPTAEDSSSSSSSLTTAVDFLMDSGGLSYEQAIHVIRQMPTVLNNGGRKPRSVIAYFESIGFSKTTHISKVISKFPRVLVSDVEKTLKPKIQVFLDFGFSESDVADLIASKPPILHSGVKTRIKPALDLIKSFVKTDEEDLMIKTIKRNTSLIIYANCRKSIAPNIDVLRKQGVPDSEIMHLIVSQRLTPLMSTPEVFKSIVQRIVSLGFEPETRKFSNAVSVMSVISKAAWDSKIDLLKGLGWSEVQILDAFRRLPKFLTLSRENLKQSIEFFKENLNWDASVLSQYPTLLNHSLKTKVIPRYAVLKCLMSKEIIKEDTMFISMLKCDETKFLSKYVFKYQDQLPYLYEEVYKKECMLGCEDDNGEITNPQDHGDVDMTV